ncbi:MAG: DUF72 domain-containing protein [Solirubrobacteraceae bacterium]
MAGRIMVGTSSWADPGFVAEWYPKGMPPRDRLAWYAERFDAVELNSSFYAIPAPGTAERWAQQTPDGFTFHVKLHRLLSRHSAEPESLPPQLRDDAQVGSRGRVALTPDLEQAMARATLEAVAPVEGAGKLGAFLLQLSPSFDPRRHDLDELDCLLEVLAPHPVAVELRHRGWVEGERAQRTLDHLSARGAVWVGVDAPHAEHFTIMAPVDAVTRKDMAYLRAHGRNAEGYVSGRSVAERFGYAYSDDELQEIGERVGKLAGEAAVVNVMFNNNRGADAPVAARRMRELLGQDPGPAPDRGRAQLQMPG